MMRALLLFMFACGPTPQHYVRYPATAHIVPLQTLTVGEWSVRFDRAELTYGPVYFCAASSAKPELCETALSEITQVTTLDLLSADSTALGDVYGLTGEIRSVNFDYGISWLPTQVQPTAGHSAVFAGTASKGDVSFRFSAPIDVVASARGIRAALGARTGALVTDEHIALDVTFDASAWWASVDFDELANVVADPVVIEPSSRAYSALVTAMQSNFPPTMQWSQP